MPVRFLPAALALLLLAGCGRKPQPDDPAPAPAPGPTPTAAPAPTPLSVVAAVPKDRLPRPGPDGKPERDAANEWLRATYRDKTLDVTVTVHAVELTDADEPGKYDTDLLVVGPDGGAPKSFGDGVPGGTGTVGGVPYRIELWRDRPLRAKVSRDEAKKLRDDLMGKEVVFRGKVGDLDFREGDDDTRLTLIIGFVETVSLTPAGPRPTTTTPPPVTTPPAAVTLETLVAGIPADKRPRPGPDGAVERNEAKRWLEANAVGKSIEFDLPVVDTELATSGDKYAVDLRVATGTFPGETKLLSDGIPLGKVTVGGVPARVSLWGRRPVWSDLDAAAEKERQALKGKTVRLRATVTVAEFYEGDDPAALAFQVSVNELVVVRSEPLTTLVAKNPGAEGRIDRTRANRTVTLPPPPKPINARDLPPPQFYGDVAEELNEEDVELPRRKTKGGRLDTQFHGEFRAYGPQRRLIQVERYDRGEPTGVKMSFHPNGVQTHHSVYVGGKEAGPTSIWAEDGTLLLAAMYKEGVPNGPGVVYYRNGKVMIETNYVNGKDEGTSLARAPDGRPMALYLFENGENTATLELVPGLEKSPEVQAALRERTSCDTPLKTRWTAEDIARERAAGRAPPDPNRKVGEWVPLFNGRNLDGWWPNKDPKGLAKWEVKDGVLGGRAQKGHVGYLYRDEDDYGDFKLKAEVRVGADGNSGLMFRGGPESLFDRAWPNGAEVQVALTDRFAKTGGLITSSSAGSRANTNQLHHAAGDWFTLEVTARGRRVEASVNGRPTAADDLPADLTVHPARGFLALQIKGAGDASVEFRRLEVMRLE